MGFDFSGRLKRQTLSAAYRACGNPAPWIEIEGRNDDVLTLKTQSGTVKVPPLAVYANLKEVHALRRFQLLVSPENRIALRLEPCEGVSREAAFTQARAALIRGFLKTPNSWKYLL